MGYIETVLEQDEKVLQWGRLHWIVYSLGLILLLGGAGMILIASKMGAEQLTYVGGIGFVMLFFSPFALLQAFIARRTTEIAVTNHRIIIKYQLI